MLEDITDVITAEMRRHPKLMMKPQDTPDCYTVAGTLDVRRIAMELDRYLDDRLQHAARYHGFD